jgi:hypothetical protein
MVARFLEQLFAGRKTRDDFFGRRALRWRAVERTFLRGGGQSGKRARQQEEGEKKQSTAGSQSHKYSLLDLGIA